MTSKTPEQIDQDHIRSADSKVLKLAKVLREDFDFSFGSRRFEDLPPGEPTRWIEIAEHVIERMKDPNWKAQGE